MSRIEHFAIYASDIGALRDFYVDALGLRVLLDNSRGDPAGYFLGDDGGMALEIIERPAGDSAVNQRYVCHVAFGVEDVAATRTALENRGIRFETETAVQNAAMHTAFFNDPEGNRCQIVWRKQPLGA